MQASKPHFKKADRTLEDIELLSIVPKNVLSQLTKKCSWSEYQKDDIIVDMNDKGTGVFFIVKGQIRVMDFSSEDQEVYLAEIENGDVFGELSALDSHPRSARVLAVEPTLLAELSSESFQKLLADTPLLALNLLRRFAGLIRRMNRRVTSMSLLSPTAHQRVYSELLRLSVPDIDGENFWVIHNAPNHQELSSWVGTDKKTVADAIGNLARNGVVERKHKDLIIRDHTQLQQMIKK